VLFLPNHGEIRWDFCESSPKSPIYLMIVQCILHLIIPPFFYSLCLQPPFSTVDIHDDDDDDKEHQQQQKGNLYLKTAYSNLHHRFRGKVSYEYRTKRSEIQTADCIINRLSIKSFQSFSVLSFDLSTKPIIPQLIANLTEATKHFL
jgi:hypothetical protein